MEKQLLRIQVAFFLQQLLERPDKFGYRIADNTKIFSDVVPIVIPAPPGPPIEMPLCILNSLDGKYTLALSKTRADFSFNIPIDLPDCAKFLEEFPNSFKDIHEAILKDNALSRIGIVLSVFIENNKSQTLVINRFIKDKKIANAKEVSVRYNRPEIFNKIDLNVIHDWQAGVELLTPQGQKNRIAH